MIMNKTHAVNLVTEKQQEFTDGGISSTQNKAVQDQIIIVGAGIADLSLALQLAENDIPCVVLEARHDFNGPTSGVRISAQGMQILQKISIMEKSRLLGIMINCF